VFECFGNNDEQTNCINITACITVTGKGIEPTGIEVDYTLNLDRKLKRITFVDGSATLQSTMNLTKDIENCHTFNLQVKDDIKDYAAIVPASLDYELSPAHLAKPLSSINDPNQYEGNSQSTIFKQDCGDDAICNYDLNLKADIVLNNGLPIHPANDNSTDLSLGGRVLVINSGESNIRVNGVLSNDGEHAFETELEVKYSDSLLGQPIEFPGTACLKPETDELPVAVNGTYTKRYLYTQVLGNILETGSQCEFYFDLSPSTLMNNSTVANFTIEMKATTSSTGSNDTNPSNNEIFSTTGIIYISNVDIQKTATSTSVFRHNPNETEINTVAEIGPAINAKYQIQGNGYATIPHSRVVFTYPSLIDNDENKRILYLHNYTCESTDGQVCTCEDSAVNSYGFPTSLTLYPNQEFLNHTNFDCQQPSSNLTCETLTCSFINLEKGQTYTLSLKMALWNATFNLPPSIEELTLTSTLEYSAEDSTLVYDRNGVNKFKIVDQMTTTAKKWKRETPPTSEPVAIWMIILAIGGGLLLLVIIGLVLWKVGFFESEAQKQMNMARMKNEAENDMANQDQDFDTMD